MAKSEPTPTPITPNESQGSLVPQIVLTLILSAILFAAGLYFAGAGLFSPFAKESAVTQGESVLDTGIIKKGSYDEGYQAGLDFAKRQLAKEGFLEGYENDGITLPLNSIQAKIKSIDGDRVVIEFDASLLDIFQEGSVTKVMVVPEEVSIEKQVSKTDEEMKKEYEEFKKTNSKPNDNSASDIPDEPLEYTVVKLKLSDLKEGDVLRIRTKDDIRTKDPFEAESVQWFFSPVVPTAEQLEELKNKPSVESISPLNSEEAN